MSTPRRAPRAARRHHRFGVERLEERRLLAVLIESFKTVQYEGSGSFSGNTRADTSFGEFKDDYSGIVNIEGAVAFSNRTQGASQGTDADIGSGMLDGIVNCLPSAVQDEEYASVFEATNSLEIDGA